MYVSESTIYIHIRLYVGARICVHSLYAALCLYTYIYTKNTWSSMSEETSLSKLHTCARRLIYV